MSSEVVGPVALNGGWVCEVCGVEQPADSTYCQLDLAARPMDRKGVPQIFAGYVIHFNGIIPRTLIHPSHAVEWRMAERHGALCTDKFDPKVDNILIYRPGYERSEKCRACVEKYTNIPAVTITWLLDSLLQSRQIHPSLYRLTSIPAVANPTVRGTDLPHHQHPYFQINVEEYSIPTSQPPKKTEEQERMAQEAKAKGISLKYPELPPGVNVPPFYEVPEQQYMNVNVFDAAARCGTTNARSTADRDNDEIEARKQKAGIDLLASQQANNRIDRMLFSGISFALSPALQNSASLHKALELCGGKIVSVGSDIEATLKAEVTHILYAHDDKKCDLCIVAAHLCTTSLPGLQLAEENWVEDCLILGELIPLYGQYIPTAKLMETLNKKYAKRA